jgi:uncharacterized protein YukE
MTEVRVDPSMLDAHAERSTTLCYALRSTLGMVESETADAAQGLAGWSTGRALEDALWRWRDDVEQAAGRASEFGDALRCCAGRYRQADHHAARTIPPSPRSL